MSDGIQEFKTGIFGLGTTGYALYKYLDNPNIKRFDPRLGYQDNMEDRDVIFICVPVPPVDGGQDLKNIIDCISRSPKRAKIFIRSTVLPGTCDELKVNALPEFLTERRAYEDMKNLPIICGTTDMEAAYRIKCIFQYKKIIYCKPREAETAKYFHNVTGAINVTIANIFSDLCEHNNIEYEKVKEIFLSSGIFTPNHIQVPGPDGFYGYGGKCFPENVASLIPHLRGTVGYDLLTSVQKANNYFRFKKIKEIDNFYPAPMDNAYTS